MKTRSGFVSNSSSSSFVIPLDNELFQTVADIALYMIPKRGWEDDEKTMKRINGQLSLRMDPNHPIAFNSCNYDTFIVKKDDGFYIATCNNHDWDFDVGGMPQNDELEHFILHQMPYERKYYNASFGITAWLYNQVDRDGYHCKEWCKECRHTELWVEENGAPYCPVCGKKPWELDKFEVWWKKHSINKAPVPQALKDSYKEVAKAGWEAAKENR
jgi:hypothetical protein